MNNPSVISVSNHPGTTALTRTPRRPHCPASSRVVPMTADLLAAYPAPPMGAVETSPTTDETLMIDIPRSSGSARTAATERWNPDVRLTRRMSSNSSAVSVSASGGPGRPALLTSTSTAPVIPAAVSMSRARSAGTVMSHSTGTTDGRSAASAASRSARRAAATTVAPAAARVRANPSPRPDEAPVTTATRPVRSNISAGVGISTPPSVRRPRGSGHPWYSRPGPRPGARPSRPVHADRPAGPRADAP